MFDGGVRFNGDTIMSLIKAQHAAGKHYVNKGSITDSSGTTQLKWLESAFLEKQAGNWKIVFIHSTRVPPTQAENHGK